ncbi:protein ADM2 [Talpa occidentalis]|uniref:protein ADM2 n=1 Tax=Talpa occidentalis TaxID=50954 RepID=UPI00188E34F4|nr:protein ADM2 [Talpa occidentalis]
MARRWALTLACVSLYLRLPGTLSRGPGGSGQPARPGEPPARTPPGGLQPQLPAPRPALWKLQQPLRPQRRAAPAPATRRRPRAGPRPPPRRPAGPRPRHARLLRVGCGLGTCRVQHLGHRLWQLVGPAGSRDSAPVDPSSPHSYG